MNYVPSIDLRPWFDGGDDGRRRVAEQVDHALRTAGFLLVTGHGVPSELRGEVRSLAHEFFDLPFEVKQRYAVAVGGRGWIPPGAEANAYVEGDMTPADMKESYSFAADDPDGGDPEWFKAKIWPVHVR